MYHQYYAKLEILKYKEHFHNEHFNLCYFKLFFKFLSFLGHLVLHTCMIMFYAAVSKFKPQQRLF